MEAMIRFLRLSSSYRNTLAFPCSMYVVHTMAWMVCRGWENYVFFASDAVLDTWSNLAHEAPIGIGLIYSNILDKID